jgi:tRNA(Met) C34 N-acetyltransferase TmcA
MAKAFYTVAFGDSRGFTNALLDLVDEGALNRDILIGELLRWMSEDEVEEFCTRNLLLRDDDNEPIIRREEDEDEAALNDFNYVGSRNHY